MLTDFFISYFFMFYLVLVVLGVCYCTGFSLVEASGGCSLAVLCRRLIVVTCLVGHRLSGAPALVVTPCRLSSYDHGLSWPVACGIFPNQGSKPASPALTSGFFTTAPSGKPL